MFKSNRFIAFILLYYMIMYNVEIDTIATYRITW